MAIYFAHSPTSNRAPILIKRNRSRSQDVSVLTENIHDGHLKISLGYEESIAVVSSTKPGEKLF